MRQIFGTLTTVLAVLVSIDAFGGAVSAGGRIRPASMECLFRDPALPLEPFHFIAFNFNETENSGSLGKLNLKTKKSSMSLRLNRLSQVSEGFLQIAGKTEGNENLRIVVQDQRPLSYKQYLPEVSDYVAQPNVQFPIEVTAFRGNLELDGQTFRGLCAKQYLFFYEVAR